MNERLHVVWTDRINADSSMRPETAHADTGQEKAGRQVMPLPEDALIILPVRNVVLFPGTILPITIGRRRSIAAAQEAARMQRPIGVLLQSKPDVEEPGPSDLHWVGTTANVLRYVTAPDGSQHIICQGEQRFRVLQFLEGYPFTVASVQRIEEREAASADIEARAFNLKQRATQILQLLPQVPEDMVSALESIKSPSRLADFIAGLTELGTEEKQSLLETFDLPARLDKLLESLSHRIEVLRLSREIEERTKESIDEQGRRRLLREQLRTIQKELGEGDQQAADRTFTFTCRRGRRRRKSPAQALRCSSRSLRCLQGARYAAIPR